MPQNEPLDPSRYTILAVDDEPDVLEVLDLNFGREFRLRAATSGHDALEILGSEPVAVLVTDQRMPEITGLELIRRARELQPDVVPIVLTGYTDVESLVDAINLGCIRRFVPKPFDPRELRAALQQGIEFHHLTRQNALLAAENARLAEAMALENRYLKRGAPGSGFDAIVAHSAAMRKVIELARRVVDSPTTVLLQGATGTGKELVANAIHHEGARAGKAFVPVNVGTLGEELLGSLLFGHRRGAFTGAIADQKGLFEVADGGTLFLDEIGETCPQLQVHLLRVLQEGEILPLGGSRPIPVDVRIIAASNRDLEQEVRRGRFREDLLHRLSVFPIRLPALAERREDIRPLAEHLQQRLAVRLRRTAPGFTPDAIAALEAHTYPGSVRELGNLIERALLLCPPGEPLSADDLFDRAPLARPGDDDRSLQAAVVRFEMGRITEMLAACSGNKTRAARQLGLTYRGLLAKMQRYGMTTGGGEQPS